MHSDKFAMTSATPSFFQRFFKPNLYQRKTSWVQRLYGLLVILISSVCLFCTTAQAANVLIITSSPVPPGKFRMLAELAGAHGVKIDTRYSEKLPASTDASVFNGYDIVMFDAPRDHIREAIQAQLHHALSGLKIPSLWLHTSEPVWKNLPEPLAKRLNTYYVNGSTPNYQHFLKHSLHTLQDVHGNRSQNQFCFQSQPSTIPVRPD
jgi:hypothetical protein